MLSHWPIFHDFLCFRPFRRAIKSRLRQVGRCRHFRYFAVAIFVIPVDVFQHFRHFRPCVSCFRMVPSFSPFLVRSRGFLRSPQLREELRRKAQQLSRLEQDAKLSLDKTRREVSRRQLAVKREEEQAQNIRLETERALAEARSGRDKVELERGEMLKGFQEVKMALEVRIWGGGGAEGRGQETESVLAAWGDLV